MKLGLEQDKRVPVAVKPMQLADAEPPLFNSFPIAMFGSVMGLTGLSIAWEKAHVLHGAPEWVARVLAAAAVLDFIVVALAYGMKIVGAPEAVVREFRHPVARSTFATFCVSLLLLPIILAPHALGLARALWFAGALGICVLMWVIVGGWMRSRHEIADVTPAWLLSVVGMLDLPLAIPFLGLEELRPAMLVGLAVGLFFAVPVFTIVFSRLIFGVPLPQALEASLLIMVAPFAVGVSTYTATTGTADNIATGLLVLTLVVLSLLLPRLKSLADCCPFRISWWAVSFPLAASTIATQQIAAAQQRSPQGSSI